MPVNRQRERKLRNHDCQRYFKGPTFSVECPPPWVYHFSFTVRFFSLSTYNETVLLCIDFLSEFALLLTFPSSACTPARELLQCATDTPSVSLTFFSWDCFLPLNEKMWELVFCQKQAKIHICLIMSCRWETCSKPAIHATSSLGKPLLYMYLWWNLLLLCNIAKE